MADAGHLEVVRIDGAEDVEVDEAVVQRRNQRIRQRMRERRQISVMAGTVDDDEVVRPAEPFDDLGKRAAAERLDLAAPAAHRLEAHMCRDAEIERGLSRPVPPVIDVMRQRFLLVVEIDGGDALTRLDQRDGDVHGNRRLAGAALVVSYNDDACVCHGNPYRTLEPKQDEIKFHECFESP